jgi:hypothetical protein
VIDGLISWISYIEASGRHPSSYDLITNFSRLLSIYLLYDNVLLNSRSELGEYLFLDAILKSGGVKLSGLWLRLASLLKVL